MAEEGEESSGGGRDGSFSICGGASKKSHASLCETVVLDSVREAENKMAKLLCDVDV